MNDDEAFLARWSRRKRVAVPDTRNQPSPEDIQDGDASDASVASVPPEETRSVFDPADLPPLETIGAGSDIRAFLAAGVPADLTRAALRRAWSADAKIRDFIGLCENSWDFNAPHGVPGFSSVTAEEVHRLMQVMAGPQAADVQTPTAETQSAERGTPPASASGAAAQRSGPDQTRQDGGAHSNHVDPVLAREKADVAMQHESGNPERTRLGMRRRHGGALPV